MMRFCRTVAISLMVCCFILLLSMGSLLAQEEPVSETIPVANFADSVEIEGSSSTLTRSEEGLAVIVHTSDLIPGNVYTVWWVIFNTPEGCSDAACGDDDIFIFTEDGELMIDEDGFEVANEEGREASGNSVLGATGAIADPDGTGHFSAFLSVGQSPATLWGPGLLNPMGAEVHIVARDHGPPEEDLDLLNAQIATFGGGCQVAPPNTGMLGEYPCTDQQAAVHLPPM